MHGYAREDGLFDIEAHLTDRKPVPFAAKAGVHVPAGETIHDMWVRLTIDDGFVIREAVAATDASPFDDCRHTPASMASMVGVRIGAGWTREIQARLGGVKSCTHLKEMLIPLGTAAYQAMALPLRGRPDALDPAGRPLAIDSCLALASTGRVVAIRWPSHHAPAPGAHEASRNP